MIFAESEGKPGLGGAEGDLAGCLQGIRRMLRAPASDGFSPR